GRYTIMVVLLVGLFVMSFVVCYRKRAIMLSSAVSWFSGKVTKLAVLAIAQALIVSLYSLLILIVEVHSSIQFIEFSIWVCLIFLMFVLFLFILSANIGWFAVLVFAVFQLSTTISDLFFHLL